jgi:hypothetical protein
MAHDPLEDYLRELRDIRRSGSAVPEKWLGSAVAHHQRVSVLVALAAMTLDVIVGLGPELCVANCYLLPGSTIRPHIQEAPKSICGTESGRTKAGRAVKSPRSAERRPRASHARATANFDFWVHEPFRRKHRDAVTG